MFLDVNIIIPIKYMYSRVRMFNYEEHFIKKIFIMIADPLLCLEQNYIVVVYPGS